MDLQSKEFSGANIGHGSYVLKGRPRVGLLKHLVFLVVILHFKCMIKLADVFKFLNCSAGECIILVQ